MNFKQAVADHQVAFGFFALQAMLNVYLADRELKRLSKTSPERLKAVGIERIDWWFGCIRGMLRLGFGVHGKGLSAFSRVLFRGVGFQYAVLSVLTILTVVGAL